MLITTVSIALFSLIPSQVPELPFHGQNQQVVVQPNEQQAAREQRLPGQTPERARKPPPKLPSETYKEVFIDSRARLALPTLDVGRIRQQDKAGTKRQRSVRIGVGRQVSVSTLTHGRWVRLRPEGRAWVFALTSPGALAIRMHFTNFSLPKDAQLFLYAPTAQSDVFILEGAGPLDSGDFWSPTVGGDTVMLEVLEPSPSEEQATRFFEIPEISHIYRHPLVEDRLQPSADSNESPNPEMGVPGSCNLDATCYSAWATTGDAVGGISSIGDGDSLWCTGTMLSNQSGDFSPYFLTANHCVPDSTAALNMEVHWFYQTSTCNGFAPNFNSVFRSPYARLLAGRSLSAGSDFSLLEIRGTVPRSLTWAGWTAANPSIGASITSMHHPQGSFRRISFGTIQWNLNPFSDFHQVKWWAGTMEPGSSGGGYFNSAHELIGQHSGGYSSCTNPGGTDEGGQFSKSYPLMMNDFGQNYLAVGLGDDFLEPNDTRGTARPTGPGSFVSLVVKVQNEDWYRISVPPNNRITIDAGFTHIYGDIDLELYRGSETSPVRTSAGTSNTEHMEVDNGGTTTDYFLHVQLANDTRNTYSLTINVTALPCTDSYEPNDSSPAAFGPLLSGNNYNGKICNNTDVDWFKVSVSALSTISFTLTVPAGKDYDLELYSPSGNFLQGSYHGSGQNEQISYSATTLGTYYVRVYGFQGAFDTANPYTLTYIFSPTPTITITTTPAGRQITVDGTNYTAPQTFISWAAGSSHTIGVSSPQSGTTGTQYVFSSWSDGGAQNHTITAPSSATTYTASFSTQYLLNTAVSPPGAGSVNPNCSGAGCWYNSGATVSLQATPTSGYNFSSWSGGISGTSNPASVVMSGPMSVTAIFVVPPPPTSTIATSPPGRQIVVDGTSYTAPQTFNWTPGSSHSIGVSSPQSGTTGTQYVFSSWSDGGAQSHPIIAPPSVTTYTASFSTQYLLNTAVSPPGAGSVNPNCSGAGCWYNSGATVSLQATATANTGYTFSSWGGSVSGTANPITFSVDGAKSVTANFGTGGVTCCGTVTLGPGTAAPGGTARVPVTLTLNTGVSADAVTFGLQVTANGGAPALTGSLDFTPSASLPVPIKDTSGGANVMNVAWLTPISPPLTGTVKLGEVKVTIPTTASDGQTYTVHITAASAALGITPITLAPGPDATVTVSTHDYLVGDVFPVPSTSGDLNGDGDTDDAGEFGDDTLNIVDLIYALRAVNNSPGYRPPTCSDRFDGIDTFPQDGASRGGDGGLNIVDLIITLRRVNNTDPSRPRRPSRGLACPPGSPIFEASLRATSRPAPGVAAATLEFGAAEGGEDGRVRVPVYLRAHSELALAGFSYALGLTLDGRPLPLRFVAPEGGAPTLVDSALPGMLAVAWLEGLHAAANQRLLLGFVEIPGAVATQESTLSWQVYGASASTQEGRDVSVETPAPVLARKAVQ